MSVSNEHVQSRTCIAHRAIREAPPCVTALLLAATAFMRKGECVRRLQPCPWPGSAWPHSNVHTLPAATHHMAVERPTAAAKNSPDARVTRGGHLLAASCEAHTAQNSKGYIGDKEAPHMWQLLLPGLLLLL